MHDLVIWWVFWWKKRKWLFSSLVAIWVLFAVYFAWDLELTSDIKAALPNDEKFSELLDLVQNASESELLYVAVGSSDADLSDSIWAQVEDSISPYTNGYFEFGAADIADPKVLYDRVPGMLLPKDLDRIDSIISASDPQEIIATGLAKLSTPESWVSGVSFTEDPYNILSMAYEHLASSEPISPVVFNDDGLDLKTGEEVRVYNLLNPKDKKENTRLLASLKRLTAALQLSGEIHYFSPVLIEAGNIVQIQKDLRWTMLISVGCIILLLVFVYRGVLVPFLFILPGLLGLLFAFACLDLLRGEVIGISIGAGSVVFGIVLDYSFHFFSHYRQTGSLRTTLWEISNSLSTSSLTTVLAFGLLLFTDPPILQDLGLFAALSLIGAAFGVLFVLPVYLPTEKTPVKVKFPTINISAPWLKPLFLVIVVIVSVIMFGKLDEASFDADLDKLNYYPDDLKHSEELFSGIKAGEEKRLFLSIQDDDLILQNVLSVLDQLQHDSLVKGFILQDLLKPSKEQYERRRSRWADLWRIKRSGLVSGLDSAGVIAGLKSGAFIAFENWDGSKASATQSGSGPSFLVANKDDLAKIKSELATISGLEIFDPRAGSTSMVEAVRENFNFILVGSSALVLIVLLLIYGRIELTLITFLPMALSWVWIVGSTVFLGIQFNFVNIILATFIFGLGDDFAIFISSSYLNKYKYGHDSIESNRTAISLSALSTLIGMTALQFAEHPAIRSISELSILGMIIIAAMSLFLQPILFKWLILNRTDRGLPPITFIGLLNSIYSFSAFVFLSAFAVLFHYALRVFPAERQTKQRFLRKLLQIGCRFIIQSSPSFKMRSFNAEGFDIPGPSVIVANHQSFVDIIQMIALSPDLVILTKKWVYNSPLFGPLVRYAGYLYTEHGADENDERIKILIDQGCSIMIFPEGTRSNEGEFKRWHKGAMYIAEKYDLDITPVLLHGFGHVIAKNDMFISEGSISYKVLDRISPSDSNFGVGYRERTKNISKWFKAQYQSFVHDNVRVDQYYPIIKSSYIYKGPVLEWYFRIKWKLEKQIIQLYDDHLPVKGRIYDLGCGSGYISLYLGLRSADRAIFASDHDEEKILVARNHYIGRSNVNFSSADICDVHIKDADGILLGDVLHYLLPGDQRKVLDKCASALLPNGKIVIREGNTDSRSHSRTRSTELWSTKIIKFNKTKNELHFISENSIREFALKNHLDLKVTWRSDRTSNTLFVLTKTNSSSTLTT